MDFDEMVDVAMHDLAIPEEDRQIVEEDLEDYLGEL